ncbi:MAG: hypothetical protein EZS28_009234 [Streblomastix strix]|uniref:Uncharacterized protein n=1 Tax=Streblomastix strix TaxID=222440 RepID=A0A5J4WK99_9EUKA|nr:MAG: hypothetical protein EZS28_009234 [Streblomastix strix]
MTEQRNLLKTQPSPVIRPGYNNQMLKSLRALLQTEGAHPASKDILLIRIVGFTGELDKEMKQLTAQQVIDLIRSKLEIMPPEQAQDLARKPTIETQLTGSKFLEYHCYHTQQREFNNRDRVKDQSPKRKKTDESEEDDFLDEIIPKITVPHLPLHKIDIESAQRIWQNRGYDLVRDPGVIKYKNKKWYSKLTTQQPFTFRDWREFWSDAGFSLEQINIPHYLSKEYKSQIPHDKSRRNESVRRYKKEKEYAIENGKAMKK